MLEIVQRFAECGYQIDPEALELIKAYPGKPESLVEELLRYLDSSTVVVSAKQVITCPYLTLDGERTQAPESKSTNERRATRPNGIDIKRPFKRDIGDHVNDLQLDQVHDTDQYNEMLHVNADSNSTISKKIDTTPANAKFKAFKDDMPSSKNLIRDLSSKGNTLTGELALGADRFSPGPMVVADQATDDCDVSVLCDITGRSTCVGEYSEFVRYFRDRYSKIRDLLSRRINARPIESLGRSSAGREVTLIGMIMDIRTTGKGHKVVELEDPTGMLSVLFQKDSEQYEQALHMVTDEVVGITGTYDGNGRIFAKNVIWPDLQLQPTSLTTGHGGALLTSDLHIGSKYFMADAWERFISWICEEVNDPSGLASSVRYLVVAGDIVDGIGVYPGQEGDLQIKDIYEQYELAAAMLSKIPSRIKVIISPGNHDIVRQAEPQPALPDNIRDLFDKRYVFVGNPSWISLGGVSCLVYHGRSIDDLVLKIPGLSYHEPEKAMVEMLRRRHLCPIYGNRVSIAPEDEDHYVIQKPPAILHCGHVHMVGIAKYKGVTAINSGTWQSQTDFQKKMNIQPTPAIVPHVDLETMRVRRLVFA